MVLSEEKKGCTQVFIANSVLFGVILRLDRRIEFFSKLPLANCENDGTKSYNNSYTFLKMCDGLYHKVI